MLGDLVEYRPLWDTFFISVNNSRGLFSGNSMTIAFAQNPARVAKSDRDPVSMYLSDVLDIAIHIDLQQKKIHDYREPY